MPRCYLRVHRLAMARARWAVRPCARHTPPTRTPMTDFRAALRVPDLRKLLAASAFTTLAGGAMIVVIRYQVYELTKDPLYLGWLGLVQAIPALTLALVGGHIADRTDRRRIILCTLAAAVLCAAAFAALSFYSAAIGLLPIYSIVFAFGIARGFADPAVGAFESQVVARELYVGGA